MVEATHCGVCGCELPPDSPGGLCPDCLLSQGLASDDDAPQPGSAFAQTTPQPGRFVPPEPAVLAPHFPQLEILEPLGHGGMGAVYKARQKKLDRIVALKIIRPESADDPAFAERFNREARTLARLSHSHIVAIHDFGEVTLTNPDPGEGKSRTLYYFLMEYVDGANLRQLITAGDLQPKQTLAVLPQICEALQYAHDEGIVHRDIKPENILVDTCGRVKIADFGLARLVSSSPQDFTLTATHQVMGTPQYMAPEQMSGSHGVDHRADIYSLGVVLYEMLTGEVPMGQFDPPSKRAPVDARLDEIVLRALAREPERRYQHASEIQSSVEQITSHGGGSIPSRWAASELHPSGGISTIAEREVRNVWRWVAGETHDAAHDHARLPTLLMILMCVAGCLTLQLPWLELQVDRTTTFHGSALELDKVVSRTYYGSDVMPGIVAAVSYGFFALLLIITPGDRPLTCKRAAVMVLLSGFLVYHTFLFKLDLESGSYSVNEVGEGVRSLPLSLIDHRITYRSGFYTSLGLSLGLLLLSAIGVRHALGGRAKSERESQVHAGKSSDTSAPLASVRFSLPDEKVIGPQVLFLFSELGYRLLEERPNEWIFQRGKSWAGLWETDLRRHHTTLTVRAIAQPGRGLLVSCAWVVKTYGAIIFRGDIAKLESEGHELEALLRENSDSPDHSPATDPVSSPHVAADTPAAHPRADNLAGGDRPQVTAVTPPSFSGTTIDGGVIFLMLTTVAAWFAVAFTGGSTVIWPLLAVPLGFFTLGGILLTIFGSAAIYEIHHSQGRVIGMPLAFAETIFFPVLLINAAIVAVFYMTIDPKMARQDWVIQVAVGVLLSIIIDYFLLRWCWRVLNSPAGSDTSTARIELNDMATATAVPSRTATGRDWITLTRDEVEHRRLPDMCIVCGTPTRERMSKTFHYTPGWTLWLLLAGVFPGIVAILMASKEMRVACPICAEHRRRSTRIGWWATIGWLSIIPLAGLGFAVGWMLYPNHGGPQAAGVTIGAVVGFFAWLASAEYLKCTDVTAAWITDKGIRLERVSPEFADAIAGGDRESSEVVNSVSVDQ